MNYRLLLTATVGLIIITAITYMALQRQPQEVSKKSAATQTLSNEDSATLLAAGDITSCDNDNDEATAKLLDANPGTIITLGDNVYNSGRLSEFTNCFAPTWGRHLSRMYPAIGNHDYGTPNAEGYYTYFKRSEPSYYSFNLGQWHLIALDSNCSIVACAQGSPQESWLKQDLATNTQVCTLAYMHHPRFSSGEHGNDKEVEPLWQTLYASKADIVLVGHDHDYERFAPQKPDGSLDTNLGIREFVVGTGGRSHYPISNAITNSETHNDSTYGVLKLVLNSASYSWNFLPVAGASFTDSGTGTCHY